VITYNSVLAIARQLFQTIKIHLGILPHSGSVDHSCVNGHKPRQSLKSVCGLMYIQGTDQIVDGPVQIYTLYKAGFFVRAKGHS
jgi:hypothetical protein